MSSKTILDIINEYKQKTISLEDVEDAIHFGGYDLGVKDTNNKTALIHACENSMFQVALTLIKTGKSLPSAVDNDGNTALIST